MNRSRCGCAFISRVLGLTLLSGTMGAARAQPDLAPETGAEVTAPAASRQTSPEPSPARAWGEWEAFRGAFISEDGRVIDRTPDRRSTSEGQAYGMFFALVGDGRFRFSAGGALTPDWSGR